MRINSTRKVLSQDPARLELQETWELGQRSFSSTEELLASPEVFAHKGADYTWKLHQRQIEHPGLVRTGKALTRGLTAGASLGTVGLGAGLAIDFITGFQDHFNQVVGVPTYGGPHGTSLSLPLGLAGLGIGILAGALSGALDDPSLIDSGRIEGVLSKDPFGARFSSIVSDPDGNASGKLGRTWDLGKESVVEARGRAGGELRSLLVGSLAGAAFGLTSSLATSQSTLSCIGAGALVAGLSGATAALIAERSPGAAAAGGLVAAPAGAIVGALARGFGCLASAYGLGPIAATLAGSISGLVLTSLATSNELYEGK